MDDFTSFKNWFVLYILIIILQITELKLRNMEPDPDEHRFPGTESLVWSQQDQLKHGGKSYIVLM